MKLIILLFPLVSVMGCSSPNHVITGLEGKPMPVFTLMLSDSVTRLNTITIPQGRPVILFYFGPYCPYSKAEMADILTNMSALQNVRFYLLTTAKYSDMMTWYKSYHLQNYPNIVLGRDSVDFFGHYFNTIGVPYLAVYDEQKKLKELLMGQMDISTLHSGVSE